MWGGASAFIAIVAYNALQFGLIGLLGGIATGVFGGLGVNLPWWVWSLGAVVLVGVLGYRQVDLSAKVLVVLVALEYLIVLLVDFAILGTGGASGLSLNLFDPSAIFSGSLTAAVLFCLGSFMGFEATTIYAEEARDPEKTIPRATYLSVLLIGGFFVFTTWLMVAGVGAQELIPSLKALSDPTRVQVAAGLAQSDELCVCDLAWITGRAENLVSQHLRTLKAAGLATSRREGKMALYALTPSGRALLAMTEQVGV